jgi:hypothetical protein
MKIPFLPVILVCASMLGAEEAPFDLGPPPTHNMFSLLQAPLVYEPQSPFMEGVGHWKIDAQVDEANVFEYTSFIYGLQQWGNYINNTHVTPQWLQWVGTANSRMKAAPFLYYFNEEITRTSVQVRTGVGPGTDLFLQVEGESHSGGVLDSFVESFHHMTGWRESARDLFAKNQCVVAWDSYGNVAFDSQGCIGPHFLDPTLGVVERLATGTSSGLDAVFRVKPSMCRTYNAFQSGWDEEAALTGYWKWRGQTFLYGAGYTYRGKGNEAYQNLDMTSTTAAHACWQSGLYHATQVYLQLVWADGYSRLPYTANFHKSALQSDFGFNWYLRKRSAVSFRYITKITQNGNTEDFDFVLALSTRL